MQPGQALDGSIGILKTGQLGRKCLTWKWKRAEAKSAAVGHSEGPGLLDASAPAQGAAPWDSKPGNLGYPQILLDEGKDDTTGHTTLSFIPFLSLSRRLCVDWEAAMLTLTTAANGYQSCQCCSALAPMTLERKTLLPSCTSPGSSIKSPCRFPLWSFSLSSLTLGSTSGHPSQLMASETGSWLETSGYHNFPVLGSFTKPIWATFAVISCNSWEYAAKINSWQLLQIQRSDTFNKSLFLLEYSLQQSSDAQCCTPVILAHKEAGEKG